MTEPNEPPTNAEQPSAPAEEEKAAARSPHLLRLSAFAGASLCVIAAIYVASRRAPEPAPSPAPQVAVEPQPASIAPVNSPAKIQALLAGAPEPLQLHFVRQLEAHPADAKRPVLKAFLGRAGEVHPGALLESVLQVKRCGAAGSRDLVELYATVSPERQRVILQAFEVLRDPSDRQALAGLKLSPTDPLAPRWASLRKG